MNSAPNVQPSPRFPLEPLLKLFARLSGVQVTLESRKQPLKGQGPSQERAWIEVDVTNFDQLGTDEMRVRVNSAGTGNDFLLRGERKLTTSLKAKSLDASLSAWSLLERIRFRIRTDLAQGAYQGAKLSLASSGSDMRIHHFNEPLKLQGEDARIIKVAILELKWNWCASAILSPTDQDGGGIIDTVNGGGPLPSRVGIIPGKLT